ncbi:MAG: phosphotransferase [Acidimicrobiia bacterium]|nr:phosphotransferase [Acidimicrobiia bacterium]
MAASTMESDVWSRASSALRTLSTMPHIQSGVSLIVSSIISSGLGFVFWIVAARQYSSVALGIGSAVITAMILLTDISQIGLRTALVRFLPSAAGDTRRLITSAYGTAVAIAVVGSLVFLAGIDLWTPALAGLRGSTATMALFVLATACWAVYLLQEGVLVGLGLKSWVAIENGAFGLLKIALLVPLAGAGDELGVFFAWALPAFAVVAVVNVGIVRHLRAGSQSGDAPTAPSPSRPERRVGLHDLVAHSSAAWAATVPRTAVIGLLPLLVLAELGSRHTAYYFLAWTIAYGVSVLSANIGDALLAEAPYDETNVERQRLRRTLLSMAISAPIVAVAVAVAPFVLELFGPEYASEATGVLRLLLLAAVVNVGGRAFVGRLRAEGRMRAALLYELAQSLSVLILGWLLLRSFGLAGLGAAWLGVLTAAAASVLIAESIWWWAPRLDTRFVTVATRIFDLGWRVGLRLPAPGLDAVVRGSLAGRYRGRPRWRRIARTSDTQTVVVSGHDGRPPLRIELARTEWGNELLGRRVRAVAELGDLTGMASFRALVPFPIDHDTSAGRHVLIESATSGRPGTSFGADRADELVRAVLIPIAELHSGTKGWLTFDQHALDRWVARPLRSLGDEGRATPEELLAIGRVICRGLEAKTVASARLHGNLTLDNALFDPTGRLMGLINWEWSDVGPAFLDRATLALSALSVRSGRDLGHLVHQLLEEPEPLVNHPALDAPAVPVVDGRSLVLLAWLHHVLPTVRASSSSHAVRFRVARDVGAVLARPDLAPAVRA